ncbi:hypothetical protein U9M48_011402 [Paspalum notatum var. saurae]|uniref:Sucrose synthase first GT-B domain-containing protein n=1 Tax=Paspalum notatum var. saurae TaxID=547442 RepID=A0AAQ3SVE0_PASNO
MVASEMCPENEMILQLKKRGLDVTLELLIVSRLIPDAKVTRLIPDAKGLRESMEQGILTYYEFPSEMQMGYLRNGYQD